MVNTSAASSPTDRLPIICFALTAIHLRNGPRWGRFAAKIQGISSPKWTGIRCVGHADNSQEKYSCKIYEAYT